MRECLYRIFHMIVAVWPAIFEYKKIYIALEVTQLHYFGTHSLLQGYLW